MRTPTDADFRSLDNADADLDPGQRSRADAMLERIIAHPVTAETAPIGARRQRRISRKVMWFPLGTAAVAIGFIVTAGPGGQATAYASWRSTPSAVAARDLASVTAACRDQAAQLQEHGPRFDAATIPVAIAERRGDFVAILFLQDNPDTAVSCVAVNRPGTSDLSDISAALGGSSGAAPIPPAGRIIAGGVSQFGDQPPASFTDGTAGAGVVGVKIHAGAQVITATVKNGRYLAWWPGEAFADGPEQPSGQGGPGTILTYDVTLNDGTTKTNVSPAPPG